MVIEVRGRLRCNGCKKPSDAVSLFLQEDRGGFRLRELIGKNKPEGWEYQVDDADQPDKGNLELVRIYCPKCVSASKGEGDETT